MNNKKNFIFGFAIVFLIGVSASAKLQIDEIIRKSAANTETQRQAQSSQKRKQQTRYN